MRVLLLCAEYPPATVGGGIGSYTRSLAPLLARAGHDVHVLSCWKGQRHGSVVETDGVTVHRAPHVSLHGLARLTGSDALAARIRTALAVRREVDRLDLHPTVIESPEWLAEAVALPRRRSPPVVVQLHGPLAAVNRYDGVHQRRGDRLAGALEARTARRAAVVVSPSVTTSAALRLIGWLPDIDHVVEWHALDVGPWSGLPAAGASAPVILAIGRLQPLKGFDVLLDAFDRLRRTRPEARLRVVGGIVDRTAYSRSVGERARSMGGVEILPPAPPDELAHHYAEARVVAVPSRFDMFSMVALEAMASARPVVCSDGAGASEAVAAWAAGTVVGSDNADDFANALAPFLDEPDLATRIGSQGRTAVTAHSAVEAVAHRRTGIYESACR